MGQTRVSMPRRPGARAQAAGSPSRPTGRDLSFLPMAGVVGSRGMAHVWTGAGAHGLPPKKSGRPVAKARPPGRMFDQAASQQAAERFRENAMRDLRWSMKSQVSMAKDYFALNRMPGFLIATAVQFAAGAAMAYVINNDLNGGVHGGAGAAGVDYADPSDAGAGSAVHICSDPFAGGLRGPYAVGVTCGNLDFYPDAGYGVSVVPEIVPGLNSIYWWVGSLDNPEVSNLGTPYMWAEYYGVPDADVEHYTPTLTPGFVEVPGGLDGFPDLDPMYRPILRPAEDPKPMPVRLLPYRRFYERRFTDEASVSRNGEDGRLPTLPPSVPPSWLPADRLRERPDGRMRWSKGYHRLARPGRRTKERKAILGVQGMPARIIGGVTEALDWINALYWALPEDVRKLRSPKKYVGADGKLRDYGAKSLLDRNRDGYISQQEKAMFVWDHLDRVNLQKAFQNIVTMEVTDAGIGYLSRKTSENLRKAHRGPAKYARPGIHIGPWDSPMGFFK